MTTSAPRGTIEPMPRRIPARLVGFLRDRRANVGILFGISAIPLIGLMGIGIDYGYMLTLKAKIDQSADAAAVAGANTASAYVASYTGTSDVWLLAQTAGQNQAKAQFQANLGSLPAGTLSSISPNVQKSNTTITSTLNYSFKMKPFVMGALGVPSMTVGGTSVSKVTLPTYVNIYVVLDTSGSMGIGSTANDQQLIANVSSNCAFACHFPGQDSETQVRQKYPSVSLRIDAAKAAVVAGLKSIPTGGNYQVAILTMGNTLTQVYPTNQVFPGTPPIKSIPVNNNVTAAINAVNTIDLASTAGTGGSDMTYTLQNLSAALATAGDGTTSEKAQGIVMFITDAIQDSIVKNPSQKNDTEYPNYRTDLDKNFTKYSPCSQSSCWDDTEYMPYISEMIFQSFDSTQCTSIKNKNYTMMTLDVQYVIPDKSLQGSQIFQDMFTNIQYILPTINGPNGTMAKCASPLPGGGAYAYSANTPADINTAVKQMFGAIPSAASVRIFQ